MQVAGKLNRMVRRLGPRWGHGQQRFVETGERSQLKRLGDQLQAPVRRGIARMAIMVATHQRHCNIGVSGPELSEFLIKRGCVAFTGVDEVPKDHKVRSLVLIQQCRDAIKVVRGVPARHRYASGAKARCLAQMHVSHEQHAALRPQQRVRRQAEQGLAVDRNGQPPAPGSKGFHRGRGPVIAGRCRQALATQRAADG